MLHAARVVVDPAQVARHQVRPGRRPVVDLALGDLVAERAQQLRGRRPPRGAARRPSRASAPGGSLVETATRRRPGSRAAASTKPPPPAAAAVEEQRGVGHAPRQRPVRRRGRASTSRLGPSEMRSRWGLMPEQPAERGRDADRAGAVGAQGDADHARRPPRRPSRRSSRPACGPATHGLRVAPNVERLGERADRQLGHVRLADDDRARRRAAARTTSASRWRGPPCGSGPSAVTSPATSVSSLIATGTPSSGRRSPAPRRASAWSASVSGAVGEHHAEGVELAGPAARCARATPRRARARRPRRRPPGAPARRRRRKQRSVASMARPNTSVLPPWTAAPSPARTPSAAPRSRCCAGCAARGARRASRRAGCGPGGRRGRRCARWPAWSARCSASTTRSPG